MESFCESSAPQNLNLLGKVNVIPVHAMDAYTAQRRLSELIGTKEVQLIKLFR